jgi:hypothetical protein
VLGHDEEWAWLLLADAGTPIGLVGNSPEAWLVALPLYAELQRGEARHTDEHLKHQVPDLRVATLPARYRRSRIPSRRSSSRSGSSRRPTTCRQPTPWFARLRDAYLEPWGRGLSDTLALAIRVGTFAHTFAWARQRDALPNEARRDVNKVFPIVLRRAVAQTLE